MFQAAIHARCACLAEARLGAGSAALRPRDAAFYLAHTTLGAPLRQLAAGAGCQPSTVLRAVRRVEARRDDPLLDDVLTELEAEVTAGAASPCPPPAPKEVALKNIRSAATPETIRAAVAAGIAAEGARPAARPGSDPRAVEKEARRILRRLSEPRAFLALARGAQVACVFRKGEEGALVTLARTPVEMAREFAVRDWIGRLSATVGMARYEISAVGRSWLKRALEDDGDARRRASEGLAEAPSRFARQHQESGERWIDGPRGGAKVRVNVGESPLGWLAKRRTPEGGAFLAPEEVAAGERLRDDFELAQIGPRVAQDWRRFLTPGGGGGVPRGPAEGPQAARDRVAKALAALGPGLEDAALRACCFLEGLEATERRMGWSARSGKVVLKIALGRLAEHYGFARAAAAPPRSRDAA